jgi:hypothetical protein
MWFPYTSHAIIDYKTASMDYKNQEQVEFTCEDGYGLIGAKIDDPIRPDTFATNSPNCIIRSDVDSLHYNPDDRDYAGFDLKFDIKFKGNGLD